MPRPRLLPDPVGQHLAHLETSPDWDAEFGFSGPLELEIGSGAGGHALEYCRRHPEVRFVAFEWRKKYARDTLDRAQKMGLRNLRVMEADARFVMDRMKPGGLFDMRTDVQDRGVAMLAILEDAGFVNPLGQGVFHPYDPE